MRPKRASVSVASRCVSASRETSHSTPRAWAPRASTSSTVPFGSARSATTTRAPSVATPRQYARPIPLAPPVTITTLSFSRIRASSAALRRAALRLVPLRDLLARREPHARVPPHELHEILDELHARGAAADERVAREHEAAVLLVHGRELRGPEVEDARGIGDHVAGAVDVAEERGVVHHPLHGHLGQRPLRRVDLVRHVVAHERAVVAEPILLEQRRRPHVHVPGRRAITHRLHAELILQNGELLG